MRQYDEGYTGLFIGPDGVKHSLHIGWSGDNRINTWWKGCAPEIAGFAGGDRIGEKCHAPRGWTDARDSQDFEGKVTTCPKCQKLGKK